MRYSLADTADWDRGNTFQFPRGLQFTDRPLKLPENKPSVEAADSLIVKGSFPLELGKFLFTVNFPNGCQS